MESNTETSGVPLGDGMAADELQITSEATLLNDRRNTSAETVLEGDKQVTSDENISQDGERETRQQDNEVVTSGENKEQNDKQMESSEIPKKDDDQLRLDDVPAIESNVSATSSIAKSSNDGDRVNVHELGTLTVKTDVDEKKAARDSARSKRKEDKAIEHVLKALSSLETTEEKLAALCKKYTELLDEHRLLQNTHKQTQKKFNLLSREKDQLQSEQSKTVLAKSKLESLCRELQKHNKIIKDESVARAKEEEEKRKEVTAKFQATINDIQQQMNENYEKNNKLRGENMELANKLKNLIEQYELREQHIEKLFKHKELELQLVEAKLAQANVQRTEEQERYIKEKQQILEAACQSQKKVEAQEQQLRNQVALYTGKYEEFQSTLAKSNEVFQSFKGEMDKMTKKIKKLEKETVMWRTRWESSNKKLLEMAEYKTRSDKETTMLQSKIQKLENLCRALQEERKKLAARIPSEDGVGINGVVQKQETSAEPTKTPPNTPEGGTSRSSPVTVEEKVIPETDNVASAKETLNIEPTPQEAVLQVTSQSEVVSQVDGQSEAVSEVDSGSEVVPQVDSQSDAVSQVENPSDVEPQLEVSHHSDNKEENITSQPTETAVSQETEPVDEEKPIDVVKEIEKLA